MERTATIEELLAPDGMHASPDRPVREWIQQADVILGVDNTTGKNSIFWGGDTVRAMLAGKQVTVGNTLLVKLDESNTQEHVLPLAAFVREIKGPRPKEVVTLAERKEQLRGLLGKGHSDASIIATLGLTREQFEQLRSEIEAEG